MSKIEIIVEIPKGIQKQNKDVAGLKEKITKELQGFKTVVPKGEVRGPIEKSAPPGTAGMPEMIQWTVEFLVVHKEEITAVGTLFYALNQAKQLFWPTKADEKAGKKGEGKAPEPTLKVKIGGEEVTLPVEETKIEKIQKELEKKADVSGHK